MLVMVSALSYAIYLVGINQSALKDMATLQVTFYVLLFGLSLFVVRLGMSGNLCVPDQWYLWGKFTGPGRFPDCRVVPVYDQCHPVYRFHTHGHSGSTGTCDGHILWGDRIRGRC